MGKASRNKRTGSTREKIAAQRAAARRAEIRNRVFLASTVVVVVIAVVVTLVLVKINSKPKAVSGSATGTTLTAATLNAVTSVPASTLDKVGAGQVTVAKPLIKIPGTHLTSNGKPEVLYVGAEYCPFCATERWAMAVALSRFGTFSGLHGIHSSPTDQYPNTPTLTFYKSSYKSNYIVFTPVETQTVQRTALQNPTAQQTLLVNKYDSPTYVPGTSQAGTIPFVDFGNQYILSGATFNPQVLQGMSWTQVAIALHDPASPIALGADGSANYITAAICKLTNNQPASACTPVVKALEARL